MASAKNCAIMIRKMTHIDAEKNNYTAHDFGFQ